MSDQRNKAEAEDERIEKLVVPALGALGWRAPMTEREVAEAEDVVEAEAGDLPGVLKEAERVWEATAAAPMAPVLKLPQVAEIEPTLARAAREGRAIPPEIEERMRRDRARAEDEQREACRGEDDG